MIAPELNFGRRKLPVVLAVEGAECGLACLTMIARYLGHDTDLNAVRQRHGFSLAGGSLRALMETAEALNLSSRAIRVELDDLGKIQTPAILHWDLNHFVVLKRAGGRHIEIHDPAAGFRRLSLADASNHFTGVALELDRGARFEAKRDRLSIPVSSLWSRLDGLWSSLGPLILLSLALQVVAFALPLQLQLVIDEAIPASDTNLLVVIALGFGALVLFQAAVEYLRGWTIQVLMQSASFQVMGNLIRHLLRLKVDFFERRHVGDILSRLSSSRFIQDILLKGAVSVLIDGVMAVFAGAILLLYAPALAAVVYGAVALNAVATLIATPAIRHHNEELLNATAVEQSMLMETVRAATTIRLMGREGERGAAWRNLYGRAINASIRAGRWSLSLSAVHSAIVGLQIVAVVYLGARQIVDGAGFSIGMLIAFLAFRQTFTDRCMNLVNLLGQIRLVGLHLERLGDIVAAEPSTASEESAPISVSGAMRCEHLSYRYGVNDRWVLKDVNLSILPGEFVAITGRSGGGKTTLIKLLLGLHDPLDGKIILEGQDARPSLWRSWREQVGVVAQDDRLISGTLAENIAFFDPDMDMARVVEAAGASRIHDEIMAMPMQYLSLVGDMGSALSGGQKQRVLLARALYRRPKILILDEGTANLDVATEEAIAQMVSGLDITRIVVAHRPALLEKASRVFLVENGEVVERQDDRPIHAVS